MESNSISVLQDFDHFYYYGQGDLSTEIKTDVYLNLLQKKRSLFYNRSYDSSGVREYENTPNAIFLAIMLPYDIVTSLIKRNSTVSNGTNGNPDRRIAVSQNSIKIDQKGGEADVMVSYINLFDYQEESTGLPISLSRKVR
jgi:hypothetical protein